MMQRRAWLLVLFGLLVIGFGFSLRVRATAWGLPYEWNWDEPEIVNPAIRVLRESVYKPSYYAYGPINAYIHAAWGVGSVLKAVTEKEIESVYHLASDWDTAWYWTVSSAVFYRQARVLSAIMWLIAAVALWQAAWRLGLGWGALASLTVFAASPENLLQTATVMPAALGIMGTALALWAGVQSLQSPSRGSLIAATFAASLAVAAKLSFFPVLAIPVLGYLVGAAKGSRRPRLSTLAWIVVGMIGFTSLLVLPAFFDPPRFIHSLRNVFAWYAKGAKPVLVGEHMGATVLAGLAAVDVARLRLVDGVLTLRQWRPEFLGVLVCGAVGLVAGLRRNPRAMLVLLVPTLLNLWHVTAYRGEFYFRNVVIAHLCLALVCGMGFERLVGLFGRWGGGWRPLLVSWVVGLLILGPALELGRRSAVAMAAMKDSRTSMAEVLQKPPYQGKRIAIAAELHWFYPPIVGREKRNPEVSVARLIREPAEAASYDYLVLPLELGLQDSSRAVAERVSDWNALLKTFPAEVVLGDQPTYYDRLSIYPKIGMVAAKVFSGVPEHGSPRIWGYELASARTRSAWEMGREGLAVRNYWQGAARVNLETTVTRLVVKARGTNPFPQEANPWVHVRVFSGRGAQAPVPLREVRVELYRSGSGMVEYPVALALEPGSYAVEVRATNPEARFMTEIEYIEFSP